MPTSRRLYRLLAAPVLVLASACAMPGLAPPTAQARGPVPATAPRAPAVPADVSSLDWERDMLAFDAEVAANPPPRGAVLFIGSSSIRMWDTLALDFPGFEVVNRGFGGSELRDSTWYAGRVVVPLAPRQVLLYAGENDLDSGRSPEQVRDDFVAFVQRLRSDLPQVRIGYIAAKPSPLRVAQLPMQRRANALVREAAASLPGVDYIDVATPMLDGNGQPRAELFIEDRLHLNAQGYDLWQEVIGPYLR